MSFWKTIIIENWALYKCQIKPLWLAGSEKIILIRFLDFRGLRLVRSYWWPSRPRHSFMTFHTVPPHRGRKCPHLRSLLTAVVVSSLELYRLKISNYELVISAVVYSLIGAAVVDWHMFPHIAATLNGINRTRQESWLENPLVSIDNKQQTPRWRYLPFSLCQFDKQH